MAVKNKEMINDDGTRATVVISSNDDKALIMNETYVLANNTRKKDNPLVKRFKGSILGTDIGIKSGGFTSIAILATVLAISSLLVMYFMWQV